MSEARAPGTLLVLSGPSGVGKDTVIAELRRLRTGLGRPLGITTRDPRPGEVDGRDYTFVDEPHFQELLRQGRFWETALVHGHHYGTASDRVEELLERGESVVIKPDVQGAAQLREQGVEGLFVFLAPPSREALLDRLRGRHTETAEELAVRIRDAERELAQASWYDHVVVNDEVGRAARELARLLEEFRPEGV